MRRMISLTLAVLASTSTNVFAQTSTCTAMGRGIVHCDHLGGGWTDCNSVGGGMATCNTMGVPSRNQGQSVDGGRALGESIGSFIAGIRDRSLRAKVGSMLAAGDCIGAAKFALEKGRLELGSEIQRSCPSGSSQALGASIRSARSGLPEVLQQIARNAATPAEFDPNTTVTKIEAAGSQLTFSATIKQTSLFTEQWRSEIVRQFCDPNGIGRVVQHGAVMRTEFRDSKGTPLGTMTINADSCPSALPK